MALSARAAGTGRPCLLVLIVLLLGGCSSADRAATTGGTGDPEPTAAAPSAAPEGYPVHAADSVQQARLRLPGGPDWLAVDDSGVWVKRDSGTVDRVDPETDEVNLTVELGGDLCQGIGAGFGAIWACSGTDVVRIDPESGDVTATFALGKAFSHGHLVTGFGRLWVLTGDGSTLVGVDPDTGSTLTSIPLGVRGTDLAVGEAGLWVVSTLDGQVLRIDPAAGGVALRVPGFDQPVALAVSDHVWVGAPSGTQRIDPVTGAVQATSEIGPGTAGAFAVGEDGVWVRSSERFLVRLDPLTAAPLDGVSADVESSGDVVLAFDSVWTTAFDDAALFRLPAQLP